MKTLYRKLSITLLFVSLVLNGFISCKHPSPSRDNTQDTMSVQTVVNEPFSEGQKYNSMGYKITPKAIKDKINIDRLPTFQFLKGKQIKIVPDLKFGYFKDSLYTYSISRDTLILSGKNGDFIKIPFSRLSEDLFDLYLNHKYIEKISIILEKPQISEDD